MPRDRSALANYAAAFAELKKAPFHGGSPLTLNKYPNKPLLLLSILDLIGGGFFNENRFFLCPELNDVFDRYWSLVLPENDTRNIEMPFDRLQTSNFWHITGERQPFTRKRVATFDDKLFALCVDATSRAVLQSVLIERHFAPELHHVLRAASATTEEGFRLSRAVFRNIDAIADAPAGPVRSQAFRATVVRSYDYRCAICGVRIFNREGRTVVEAAHIQPWSVGHNDDPTNGVSLCGLCHWTFDSGLLAIAKDFTILTSERLRTHGNLGGHLTTVTNRVLFLPTDPSFRPSTEKTEWHREKIFVA